MCSHFSNLVGFLEEKTNKRFLLFTEVFTVMGYDQVFISFGSVLFSYLMS